MEESTIVSTDEQDKLWFDMRAGAMMVLTALFRLITGRRPPK